MESKMNIYYDDDGDYLEITNGDTSNSYFDNAVIINKIERGL